MVAWYGMGFEFGSSSLGSSLILSLVSFTSLEGFDCAGLVEGDGIKMGC